MSELMTVEELSLYLRFTRRTIYSMLEQGTLPAFKLGSKWRFSKSSIDKWLQQKIEGVKLNILVIDDEDSIRTLFKETLKIAGHSISSAINGTEGIKSITENDYNLVFLDLKLPDISGVEVIRQARIAKPDLLVTVITGYPDSEMMQKALDYAPFAVMSKPFTSQDIISTVNKIIAVTRT